MRSALVIAMTSQPSAQKWKEIDRQLSQSHVLNAVRIYRQATGCGIAQAKEAVGTRFRERYPERWASYHDVLEESVN